MPEDRAQRWAQELYGISGHLKPLVSYHDINFQLEQENGQKFIMKLAASHTPWELLEAQDKILRHLLEFSNQAHKFPKPIPSLSGENLQKVAYGGHHRCLRLLSYLEGKFLNEVEHSPQLMDNLGMLLGSTDLCLSELNIPAISANRTPWDLQHVLLCHPKLDAIVDPHYRRLAYYFLQQFEYQVIPRQHELRQSIIHGDANDQNILVKDKEICGLIDFGDACHTYLINELAIALPYVMMHKASPLEIAGQVVKGYHQQLPLHPQELEVLYYLINARLSLSLIMSSWGIKADPQNQYLVLHQQPVKDLMDTMLALNPLEFENKMKSVCDLPVKISTSASEMLTARQKHINSNLSISYRNPLRIYKGAMQYLYERDGRTLLDGVNNICHVGHCHPRVVEAAGRQASQLNTNTRYLYSQLNDYAARLCETLPEPLSVVFFVNSGSEANDLALRMARTHRRAQDVVVLGGAYHGNSTATIEVSPYKYNSQGGPGRPSFIHEAAMPDLFRGKHRSAELYLNDFKSLLQNLSQRNIDLAAFIAESVLSCGGQIVLPHGYLQEVYQMVRDAGGLCIADEVQVGFGRVGSHFWAFQTQQVIPDIVTMGKPMGNGHPLAAVVTTPEIASSFDTGMEYFNSFGGNPVSCEIGMAVLDILEEEQLSPHALTLGEKLLGGWKQLQKDFPEIGEVRGLGLFLGIELIKPGSRPQPNAPLATRLVEAMLGHSILLSTDGRDHNVIKFKPPMVFTDDNAQYLLESFQTSLTQIARS